VATLQSIRAILVAKQRELGYAGGIVMDGRDIGTVVFPDAEVKFYLDATPEARGRRRWLELQQRGEERPLREVIEAIRRRDHEDQTRAASPLRIPEGAYYIDTTNLSVDDVFEASPSALLIAARERDAPNRLSVTATRRMLFV
jgi:cytidylate kinase